MFPARTLTDKMALLDSGLFTARKNEFTECSKIKTMWFYYGACYQAFIGMGKDPI